MVSWLAQHNFPHGMVAFMDGISTDPLRQKMTFLQRLKDEAEIVIKVRETEREKKRNILTYSWADLLGERVEYSWYNLGGSCSLCSF